MKKLSFMLFATIVLVAISAPAWAENEPLEKGMFFGSYAACKAAYESGEFRFYQPDPRNLKTPPASAKGLPRAGCALEDVRENEAWLSPAWVVLASNVPSVFDSNGTPSQDGRCHNTIHEFEWLPLILGLKGDKGDKGDKGIQGKDAPFYGRDDPKPSEKMWVIPVVVVVVLAIIAKVVYQDHERKEHNRHPDNDGTPPSGGTGGTSTTGGGTPPGGGGGGTGPGGNTGPAQ